MNITISKRNMVEIIMLCLLEIVVMFNSYRYGTLLAHVMIILLLFMLYMLVRKAIVVNATPYLSCGLIWCLTFVVGTLMAGDGPYVGDAIGIFYISILIIFTCMFMGIDFEKNKIEALFSIYIICNVFVSVNIVINFLTENYYVDQRASFLINGVYKDPNYVTALIVPAFLLLFLKLRKTKRILQKLIFAATLGLMLMAILMTGTRAALVGIFASIIVYFTMKMLRSDAKPIYKFGIILCAIVAVIMVGYIIMNYSEGRFTDISAYMNDIRVVIWTDALSFWTKSPIIGNGVNAASNYTLTCWYGRATHNCFLDLLGDSGLLGVMCFFAIMRLIVKGLRDNCTSMAFIAACLVPQAFINGFYGFNFWFLLCLIKMLVDYQKLEEKCCD